MFHYLIETYLLPSGPYRTVKDVEGSCVNEAQKIKGSRHNGKTARSQPGASVSTSFCIVITFVRLKNEHISE